MKRRDFLKFSLMAGTPAWGAPARHATDVVYLGPDKIRLTRLAMGTGTLGGRQGRILGIQGQLWSQFIPTLFHLEYMAFPRLAALAEVAWTPAARRDYAAFIGRLRVQEQRWRIQGVNFRP